MTAKGNGNVPRSVRVSCTAAGVLGMDALIEFQGALKKRTDKEFAQIMRSIERFGFSFPFFVWKHDSKNFVFDGHGRLGALQRMRDQGWAVPELPVAFVEAEDEADARAKMLRLNSTYGRMTKESVLDFAGSDAIQFDEIMLPDGVIDFGGSEDFDPEGGDDADAREDEVPAIVIPCQSETEMARILLALLESGYHARQGAVKVPKSRRGAISGRTW